MWQAFYFKHNYILKQRRTTCFVLDTYKLVTARIVYLLRMMLKCCQSECDTIGSSGWLKTESMVPKLWLCYVIFFHAVFRAKPHIVLLYSNIGVLLKQLS